MTENKRYKVAIYDEKAISGYCVLDLEKPSQTARLKYNNIFIGTKEGCDIVCDLLNEQEETIQNQNQEIIACHDTLTTIHELCYAVLNYDFKNVNDKIDFCHMLNEMDNKDLMFLKECFEAIRGNDLKRMTSLTVECNGDVE